MRFMMNRRCVALVGALLLVGAVSLSVAGESGATKARQGDAAARQATFEVRHELKVNVSEGAQRVRVWFVLPQEDPVPGDGTASAQQVGDLQIDAPYPYRVERDSEGSKLLYLEATNPTEKELKIVETFVLTRHEVRMSVDPSRTKPLTEADRAKFAPYLAANKHVEIDDEVRMVWSIGRDLILNPKQDGEPVNAMAKAYVEIDGKMHLEGTGWVRKLTYRERRSS